MKKLWTTLAACLMLTMALPIAACSFTSEGSETLEGNWALSSATLDGVSVKKDFQAFTAVLRSDRTMRVTVSYFGSLTTRDSTYTFDGTTLKESYSGEKFTYTYSAADETLTTVWKDYTDEITVVLAKQREEDKNVPVKFNGLLFGPDMSDSKIYNYCPAILKETENGQEVMHVWYCTNRDDGVMMDYIGYRKGVKQSNGKWLFSEQQIVLSPTPDTWDARHTCDPAVIRGNFRYQGTQYSYLMAYLGCVTEDYQKNETGIAVANAPEGPWVKVNTLNPLVPWCDDGNEAAEQAKYESYKGTERIYWGTGMPALVSVDGEGDVLMFYQSTLRGTGIRRYDFSDLDAPLTPAFTVSISSQGILNSQSQSCRIGIPDFAYDETNHRFYVCGVTNEKNPPDISTTRVNSHSMVAYIENVNSTAELATLLQNGGYTWKMLGYVGPDDTGFERNHNPGIVRNKYGYLPNPSKVEVIVSTGHNSWENENIFTYRLHGKIFTV